MKHSKEYVVEILRAAEEAKAKGRLEAANICMGALLQMFFQVEAPAELKLEVFSQRDRLCWSKWNEDFHHLDLLGFTVGEQYLVIPLPLLTWVSVDQLAQLDIPLSPRGDWTRDVTPEGDLSCKTLGMLREVIESYPLYDHFVKIEGCPEVSENDLRRTSKRLAQLVSDGVGSPIDNWDWENCPL